MNTTIQDIFLKQMLNIKKNLFNLHKDLPFLPEREKIEKCEKLIYNMRDKKTMLFT